MIIRMHDPNKITKNPYQEVQIIKSTSCHPNLLSFAFEIESMLEGILSVNTVNVYDSKVIVLSSIEAFVRSVLSAFYHQSYFFARPRRSISISCRLLSPPLAIAVPIATEQRL